MQRGQPARTITGPRQRTSRKLADMEEATRLMLRIEDFLAENHLLQ